MEPEDATTEAPKRKPGRPPKPKDRRVVVTGRNVHTSLGRIENGWQGVLPAQDVEDIQAIDAANGTQRIVVVED